MIAILRSTWRPAKPHRVRGGCGAGAARRRDGAACRAVPRARGHRGARSRPGLAPRPQRAGRDPRGALESAGECRTAAAVHGRRGATCSSMGWTKCPSTLQERVEEQWNCTVFSTGPALSAAEWRGGGGSPLYATPLSLSGARAASPPTRLIRLGTAFPQVLSPLAVFGSAARTPQGLGDTVGSSRLFPALPGKSHPPAAQVAPRTARGLTSARRWVRCRTLLAGLNRVIQNDSGYLRKCMAAYHGSDSLMISHSCHGSRGLQTCLYVWERNFRGGGCENLVGGRE